MEASPILRMEIRGGLAIWRWVGHVDYELAIFSDELAIEIVDLPIEYGDFP